MFIKTYFLPDTSQEEAEYIGNSLKCKINLIQSLDCQNIIDYLGVVTSLNSAKGECSVSIVMEYIPDGITLQSLLKSFRKLNENVIQFYTLQCLKTIECISTKMCKNEAFKIDPKVSLYHHNIKSSNILITPEGDIRLTNFGFINDTINGINKNASLISKVSPVKKQISKDDAVRHQSTFAREVPHVYSDSSSDDSQLDQTLFEDNEVTKSESPKIGIFKASSIEESNMLLAAISQVRVNTGMLL